MKHRFPRFRIPDAADRAAYAVAACLVFAAAAEAKWTTPACPDFKRDEFRYVKLVTKAIDPTLDEPLKAAFDMHPDGKVDIWFVERHGRIKVFDAAKNTVSVAGQLNVYSDSPDRAAQTGDTESGLNGIALDPGFKTNHWIYLYYSPWEKPEFRVSRFTIKAGKLDPASEKILFAVPEGRMFNSKAIVLPGGSLAFDLYGDLWITFGANSKLAPSVNETDRTASAEASSANLGDLRGSILRVHPDGSEKGYSIPAGNLGAFWSARFAAEGKADLAGEYADPVKVRPEIFVKGTRNPYSISVDPTRRWAAWGDFGPNGYTGQKVEELNLASHPLYAGYPYWSGRNLYLLQGTGAMWAAKDPAAPMNLSKWNQGPQQLPPAEPALYGYALASGGFVSGNHPTSGPIYRYDGALQSSVKFPPHFEKTWFTVDFLSPGLRLFETDEAGSRVTDSLAFMQDLKFERPLDLKQGPDGALYVVDYGNAWHATSANAAIGRIEYTGACRPSEPRLEVPNAVERGGPGAVSSRSSLALRGRDLHVETAGGFTLRLRDAAGREIGARSGRGPQAYPLMDLLPGRGLYIAVLEAGGVTGRISIPEL